jgi:hypothetical protein
VVVRVTAVGNAFKIESEFNAPKPPVVRELYHTLLPAVRAQLFPRLMFGDGGKS